MNFLLNLKVVWCHPDLWGYSSIKFAKKPEYIGFYPDLVVSHS